MQSVQIRQHPEYRLARVPLQPIQPGLQQRQIATEAVDDESADAVALAVTQQCQRPHQVRENAAAVDVGDEHDRAVDRFRESHVGNVARRAG